MPLLYHAYVYLEFLILACTIYILAPKVCFTHKKYPQYKSTYYIHGSENEKYLKSMMDYVHQWWIKRYYDQFDFVDWLNQGGCNWKGKE